VATVGAPVMSPPSSSAPSVPPFAVMASCYSFSRPRVSLDHLYTSSDADSLWGASYRREQKTLDGFVSTFDKNLILLAGVQNAMDSTKVFP